VRLAHTRAGARLRQQPYSFARSSSSIDSSLAELIGSEEYPNFTDIKTNDNYTAFTITTSSIELDFAESSLCLCFICMAGCITFSMRQDDVDNVSVSFVNADTGEVISSANSSEMGE